MVPFDPRYASISDLQSALVSGRATAQELAEESIAILRTEAPTLRALAALLPERTTGEASAANERLRRERSRSALCGIPYGAKDIFAAAGAPTTWGTSLFRQRVIERDATVITRLKQSGAVLIAKLATVELAGAGRPSSWGSSVFGQGRNPWAPDRYSGGSSSGSAIGVAIGAIPFALGSETGGSIIGPAAFCGVTGFRPTAGIIPRGGMMTLSPSLDKVGIIARSAHDCRTVLAAIRRRPLATPTRPPNAAPVRVAVPPAFASEVAPSMRRAMDAALADLQRISSVDLEVIRADIPYGDILEMIMNVEAAYALRSYLESGSLPTQDARQLQTLRVALTTPALDYLAAREAQTVVRTGFSRLFDHADFFAAAAQPHIAPRLDAEAGPRTSATVSDQVRSAANLAGLPGVSIPVGLSDEGMPVAIHVVGPRGSDERLLAFAARYQSITNHHQQRPPPLADVL